MTKRGIILSALGLIAVVVWWHGQRGPAPAPGEAYPASGSPTAPLDALLERGREEEKPVVLLFTGSTWCPPCKRLANKVLVTDQWAKLVREDIIFVVYDFPRSGGGSGPVAERREAMAERFGVRGFPTLVVLDEAGGVAAQRSGASGVDANEYISWARGKGGIE
ncbi:MAG: thioredoxin family protein [Opitutales bacterium]